MINPREMRTLKAHLKKTCKVMRLTALLLLIGMGVGNATATYSQSTHLSISLNNKTVKEVFNAIEKSSEYIFFYYDDVLDLNRKVSLDVENQTVDKILDKLFESTDNTYVIEDRQIFITAKEPKAKVAAVRQQSRKITGVVVDDMNEPLIGVNILVKETTTGTITDLDGKFSLTTDHSNPILVVSYIGHETQEIRVGNRQNLNIVLKAGALGLDEVVVVGYGSQKKINLTGSVSVADKEVFENKAVPNTIAALQGALPGVMVTKTSGKPGSENYQMNIRGASSANSVNTLVIIDGAAGSINDVNPTDIESMTVLKDAAASSIYGSNAAGGVILITTKKGVVGKPVFELSSMFGFNTPTRLPNRLDSWVEMDMWQQSSINAGLGIIFSDVEFDWLKGINLDVPNIEGVCPDMFFPGERFIISPSRPNVWFSYDNVDRIKAVVSSFNPIHQHNFSVKGGSEASRYFISGGYYSRDGIMKYGPDGEERYTMRLNLNNKLSKHFHLNTSFAYTNSIVEQAAVSPENVLSDAYHLWGIIPDRLPTGEYFSGNGIWDSQERLLKESGKDTRKKHMLDGKIELNIKDILPGWDANVIASKRLNVSTRNFNRRTLVYDGPLGTPTFISGNPNYMFKNQDLTNYSSLQAFSTYNKSFADAHNFSLLGGYSYEDYRYEFTEGGISSLITNDFYSLNWGDPKSAYVSDNILTYRTMAFFGRLNYNFKEKYLFEANLRYDASSKLAPSKRWNLFPSFSAGWNISKENFFQDVDFVNTLKLRASWGQLGNSDALGYYDYIGLLNTDMDLPFNNSYTQYIYQNTLASETKSWETIETTNVGVDIGMFNNRLNFTGDVYVKRNKNMLAYLQTSSIIGVGLPTYNVGELKTRGWEIGVTWKDSYKDFNYWVSVNLSDNTNKLVRYEGRDVVNAGRVPLLEGYPLNSLWGYKTDGLFQSDQEYIDNGVYIHPNTGEGDMKYVDLDGDKRINAGGGTLEDHGDLVHLGDDTPRYLFGLNLGFQWKSFDFSCLFQGVGKRNFFLAVSEYKPIYRDWKMPWKEHLDYWTPENRDAFWPRLYGNSEHSYWDSDYWIQNGAYLRCKNMEVGYTLPAVITRKVKIDKARFFVSGQDLFEITNVFSWVDPEFPHNAGNVYPFYRSASIGINVTF